MANDQRFSKVLGKLTSHLSYVSLCRNPIGHLSCGSVLFRSNSQWWNRGFRECAKGNFLVHVFIYHKMPTYTFILKILNRHCKTQLEIKSDEKSHYLDAFPFLSIYPLLFPSFPFISLAYSSTVYFLLFLPLYTISWL